MRIGLGVVSIRDHKARFVESLTGLLMHTLGNGHQWGMQFFTPMFALQSSVLSWGREIMLDRMKDLNLTHLLFIDDDMVFPPEALQILSSRNVDVIAANYVTKNHEELNFTAYDLDNKQIDSRGKIGIQEASRVGFGMILLKASIFEKILAPHFEVLWDTKSKYGYKPEDFYCVQKLRECGIKVFIDHDLSAKMGHVGDYVYTQDSPFYPKP